MKKSELKQIIEEIVREASASSPARSSPAASSPRATSTTSTSTRTSSAPRTSTSSTPKSSVPAANRTIKYIPPTTHTSTDVHPQFLIINGQYMMHAGSGVYIPTTNAVHSTNVEADGDWESGEAIDGTAVAYISLILVGATILGVFAPFIWDTVKSKYSQFKKDFHAKQLGKTIDLSELAKEIEGASTKLSPQVRKYVERLLTAAKQAKTPTELGHTVKAIRDHVKRHSREQPTSFRGKPNAEF